MEVIGRRFEVLSKLWTCLIRKGWIVYILYLFSSKELNGSKQKDPSRCSG